MSSTQDVRFNEEKVAQGRQLANKLWNASRLVLLRLPDGLELSGEPPRPEAVEDAWILSRLQAAKAEVARAIDAFEFHHAVLRLYAFVYDELCDWYLELVKPRLYGADDGSGAAAVALHVLAETLALAHPIIPFVTEEIWAHVPGTGDLLMAHGWPEPDPALSDPAAEDEVRRAIAAVQELRGWRDRVGAAAGATVPGRLEAAGFERTAPAIARLARFEWQSDAGEAVATVGVPGGAVVVLASEAVDTEAEARRARERHELLRKEIARAQSRLANQGFVAKAPEAVVQAERDKLARLESELEERNA
jgi:valyl-tRNA synthetase